MVPGIRDLWLDLRSGLRGLLQHKIVSGLAILSLTLAIAGNTAVFSVASGMFLRPLPFEEPDRLAFVADRDPDNTLGIYIESVPNFLDLRDRTTSFEELVAFRGASLGLERDAEPEPVSVMQVSEGFFEALRWRPFLGRTPLPEEEAPGGPPVALLTHNFWTTRFAADPDALGRDLDLSGERHQIVGILPPDTEFLDPTLGIFTPLRLDPASPGRRDRGGGLSLFGRLAPGVTLEQADGELEQLGRDLAREYPDDNRGYSLRALSLRDRLIAPPNRALIALLQAGLFLVLLIACANVANLLLAQGQQRERELAVRASLGAGRRRIIAQLLVESLALALIAFGLGTVLAAIFIDLMRRSLSAYLPPSFQPRMEPSVLLFTVGIAALSGLLFALLPAVRASRPDLTGVLREGGRSDVGPKRWLAKGLVVAQVTLAMSLLAGSSILMQAMQWLQHSSPGFSDDGLFTVDLQPPSTRHPTREDLISFYEQVGEELDALPGVETAAAVTSLPRSPFTPTRPYALPGEERSPDAPQRETMWLVATPGYFRTLGVSVLRGRDFGTQDRADSPPVVIVSQSFAARHWTDSDPLDQPLVLDGVNRRVIGVVADVWQELLAGGGSTRSPAVYVPHAQAPARGMNVVVRASGATEGLPGAIRAAVWDVDPRLSVGSVLTFEEYVGQFFGTQGLGFMMRFFGGLALLLAAIGIYGVIAFSVGRRTQEIGLRMALGADHGRILRLIGIEGIRLLAIGVALGSLAVLAVNRAVAVALSGLAPIQPLAALPMLLILVAVALAATYLPARRAATLQPVEALRD